MSLLVPGSVKLSYKDVVQVEKSGAGYPSGANETALYDGAGNQIIPRTAVRHWLDPHPDAAAFDETWEFSTTGDMTQAQLESAGWTFENCTAEVANGILWTTATSAAIARAYLTVSLTGDFDFVACPVQGAGYGDIPASTLNNGGLCVADTATDVAYFSGIDIRYSSGNINKYVAGSWTALAGATSASASNTTIDRILRVWRVSGTVYVSGGSPSSFLTEDATAAYDGGFVNPGTVASAVTFNRISLLQSHTLSISGARIGFKFLRRFQ